MKELSIEEKARAYDIIIEKANKMHHENCEACQACIEELIPELKESEDERIGKQLLNWFKGCHWNSIDNGTLKRDDIIAWLKKQGNKNTHVILPTFTIDDVLALQCCLETVKKVQEDKDLYKQLNDLHSRVYDVYQLEKQGKQKSVEDLTQQEAMDIAVAKCFEQGEQKPDDKGEPKFKVGDWINGYYTNYKVLLVNNNGYIVEDVDGNKINILFENEKFHSLWTIQDAKDGDVLSDGTTIFIFKDLLSDGSVMSYCDYDTDSDESDAFCPLSVNLMCSKITPATKVQCNILFGGMADAGYEWDADKKELKKIEQKPIIEMKSAEESLGIDSDTYNKIVDECIYGEQKPTEEITSNPDYISPKDKALFEIASVLSQHEDKDGSPLEEIRSILIDYGINNLESNEQKPAWSEEDEKQLNDIMWIIKAYRKNGFNETHIQIADSSETWLKSLKERYIWKPSDEQMEALKEDNLKQTYNMIKIFIFNDI